MTTFEIIMTFTFALLIFKVFDMRISFKRRQLHFDQVEDLRSSQDYYREYIEEQKAQISKLQRTIYMMRNRAKKEKKV